MSLTRISSTAEDWKGTHIVFVFLQAPDPAKKTKVWAVENAYGDGNLGLVKWFPRWRKYSFFPQNDCIFEEVCMREISEFLVARTQEHKGK